MKLTLEQRVSLEESIRGILGNAAMLMDDPDKDEDGLTDDDHVINDLIDAVEETLG